MIDWQKDRIEQMVGQGKTIVQICEELDLEWKEVAQFLYSVDKTSWLGAKRVITRRLNRLVKENDESVREELAKEAAKWIDYLYYDGKRLSRQVEQARRAMDSARRSLDG